MNRILSISYDEALLQTRAMLLRGQGFDVVSAKGFSAALSACETGSFDLVILGHSIPQEDQQQIIKQLRAVCGTPILALRRPNESALGHAEYNLESGDPKEFINHVQQIVRRTSSSTL
jgi:DNA-binding response OmpR family regulator